MAKRKRPSTVLATALAAGGTGSFILNVHDFGRALYEELRSSPSLRQKPQNPIILIGHSMGGLVIKKAVILAHQDGIDRTLADRIRCIFFLATPHRGSDYASVLNRILKVTGVTGLTSSREYIGDLTKGSTSAMLINDDFGRYADNLLIYSFYETLATDLGISSSLIVEKDSAILAGSCQWIDEREDFKEWRDALSESDAARKNHAPWIYWVNANPGAGKTVLATYLQSQFEEFRLQYAFYHFHVGKKTSQSLAAFLRSVAFQMAISNAAVREAVAILFSDDSTFDQDDARTIWSKVFKSVIFQIPLASPQFWIIDAMDECLKYAEFFSLLKATQTRFPLRIFITSRKLPDTQNDEEKQSLTQEILSKSDASFLWVRLVMDELEGVYGYESIMSVLQGIPEGMMSYYQRIVAEMAANRREKHIAKAILIWVVTATRPLSIHELSEAIKLDIKVHLPSAKSAVEGLCGQLVSVDNQTGLVHILHATAREFLLSEEAGEFKIPKSEAHERIALTCLQLLTSPAMQPPRHRNLLRQKRSEQNTSSLLHYAITQFSEHLVGLQNSDWDDCAATLSFEDESAAAVACDNSLIAVGFDSGNIHLYNHSSCQKDQVISHGSPIDTILLDPLGSCVAASGIKFLTVWDLGGNLLWKKRLRSRCILLMSSSTFIFGVTMSGKAFQWALADGELLAEHLYPYQPLDPNSKLRSELVKAPFTASISPEFELLALAYSTGPICIYELQNHSWITWAIDEISRNVAQLVFNPNPDVNLLLVAYDEGHLTLYESWSGIPVQSQASDNRASRNEDLGTIDPYPEDGGGRRELIYAGNQNGNVLAYNSKDGRQIGILYSHHNASIKCLAVSNSKVLASGDINGTIQAWQLDVSPPVATKASRLIFQARFTSPIVQMLFNQTGEHLLISTIDSDYVYDVNSGTLAGSLVFSANQRSIWKWIVLRDTEHAEHFTLVSDRELVSYSSRNFPAKISSSRVMLDYDVEDEFVETGIVSAAFHPETMFLVLDIRQRRKYVTASCVFIFELPRTRSGEAPTSLKPVRILTSSFCMRFLGINRADKRLIFLHRNSWVSSINLLALHDQRYTQHFFVPNEFITNSDDVLPLQTVDTAFAFCLYDKLAVIKNGLKFQESKDLE
ncbi:hypothetical protein DL769_003206 [Monosporascus sp. CRB-8-3]|nr:hypothetical protein DL769_003206 [Monosporascus sp. CRB-8-3]